MRMSSEKGKERSMGKARELSAMRIKGCQKYLDAWLKREASMEAEVESGLGQWTCVAQAEDALGSPCARFENQGNGWVVAVSWTEVGWVPARISEEQLEEERRESATERSSDLAELAIAKNIRRMGERLDELKKSGRSVKEKAARALVRVFERCHKKGEEEYEPSKAVVERLAREAAGIKAKNWEGLLCSSASLAARYGDMELLAAVRKADPMSVWEEDEGKVQGSAALSQAGLLGNKPMAKALLEWMLEDTLDGKKSEKQLRERMYFAEGMSRLSEDDEGLSEEFWEERKTWLSVEKERGELARASRGVRAIAAPSAGKSMRL